MRAFHGGLAIAAALTALGGSPIGWRRGPRPNRYRPHIGAKQRGKYQPNMPLHGPLPFYREQEAPLAMAA